MRDLTSNVRTGRLRITAVGPFIRLSLRWISPRLLPVGDHALLRLDAVAKAGDPGGTSPAASHATRMAVQLTSQVEREDGIVPLESNALRVRYGPPRPGPDYVLHCPEQETAQTEDARSTLLLERRLRQRIGKMVAQQAVEDEGAVQARRGAVRSASSWSPDSRLSNLPRREDRSAPEPPTVTPGWRRTAGVGIRRPLGAGASSSAGRSGRYSRLGSAQDSPGAQARPPRTAQPEPLPSPPCRAKRLMRPHRRSCR
jgi:hypothetical protein